jgi:hypothetical protein
MKNPVGRAIEIVGGPTKASFITQFSAAQIYNWRDQGYVKDGKAAVLLARASGVPVEELVGLEATGPNGGGVKSTATSCDGEPTATESLDRLDEQILSPLPSATACAA